MDALILGGGAATSRMSLTHKPYSQPPKLKLGLGFQPHHFSSTQKSVIFKPIIQGISQQNRNPFTKASFSDSFSHDEEEEKAASKAQQDLTTLTLIGLQLISSLIGLRDPEGAKPEEAETEGAEPEEAETEGDEPEEAETEWDESEEAETASFRGEIASLRLEIAQLRLDMANFRLAIATMRRDDGI